MNRGDTLSLRERSFGCQAKRSIPGHPLSPAFPALFGEAVAGFNRPVLGLIRFFGLVHGGFH